MQAALKAIRTQLLLHAHTTYPPTITIDDSDREVPPWDIVPLAGLLLEYAVAYVPDEQSMAASGFMSGVELEIYSCALVWEDTEGPLDGVSNYTFVQFSCPSSVAQQTDDIGGRLHDRFTTRLASAGLDCTLRVSSHTTCLDRVAL